MEYVNANNAPIAIYIFSSSSISFSNTFFEGITIGGELLWWLIDCEDSRAGENVWGERGTIGDGDLSEIEVENIAFGAKFFNFWGEELIIFGEVAFEDFRGEFFWGDLGEIFLFKYFDLKGENFLGDLGEDFFFEALNIWGTGEIEAFSSSCTSRIWESMYLYCSSFSLSNSIAWETFCCLVFTFSSSFVTSDNFLFLSISLA